MNSGVIKDTVLVDLPDPDGSVAEVIPATLDSMNQGLADLRRDSIPVVNFTSSGDHTRVANKLTDPDYEIIRTSLVQWYSNIGAVASQAGNASLSASTVWDASQAETVKLVTTLARERGPQRAVAAIEAAARSMKSVSNPDAIIAGRWLEETLSAAKYQGKLWGLTNRLPQALQGVTIARYHAQFARLALSKDMISLAKSMRALASAARLADPGYMTARVEELAVRAIAAELGVVQPMRQEGVVTKVLGWAKATPPVKWVSRIGGKAASGRRALSIAGRTVGVLDFATKVKSGNLSSLATSEAGRVRNELADFLATPDTRGAIAFLEVVQGAMKSMRSRVHKWALEPENSIVTSYFDSIIDGMSKSLTKIRDRECGALEYTIRIYASVRAAEACFVAFTDKDVVELEGVLERLGQASAGSSLALVAVSRLAPVIGAVSVGIACDTAYQAVWMSYEQHIAAYTGRALLELPGSGIDDAMIDYDRFMREYINLGPYDDSGRQYLEAIYRALNRSLAFRTADLPSWYVKSPGRIFPLKS